MRYKERKLEKKTLIVGATCGVGEAVASFLCEQGHTVVGAARSKDRLNALTKTIGPSFEPYQLDIGDPKQVHRMVQLLEEKLGSFDVVNMAFGHIGEDEGVPIGDLDDEDIEAFCRSSVLGNWFLAKYLSKTMKENQRRWVQINADWGLPQHNILLGAENSKGERIGSEFFASAKHAITGLTNSMERLSGFETTGIYPGAIASMSSLERWYSRDTPVQEVLADPFFEDEMGIPLQDIAEAVRFALSVYSVPKQIVLKPRNIDYDGVGI